MSFENSNSISMDRTTKNYSETKNHSRSKSVSSFKRLLQTGRLTDQDLENFHSNILKAHKKRHHNVLAVSGVILICLLILFYFAY